MASYQNIVEEFTERKALVDQDAHEKRDEKRNERKAARACMGVDAHRSSAMEGDEDAGSTASISAEAMKELEIPDFDTYTEKQTRFFTTGDPCDYTYYLIKHLMDTKTNFKLSDNTLKVAFDSKLEADEEEGEESKEAETPRAVRVVMRVFACTDEKNTGKYCIDFNYHDPKTNKTLQRVEATTDHFVKLRDETEKLSSWFNDIYTD